ncbi:MAG: A22B family peptidase [Armatimonadota bacterium]
MTEPTDVDVTPETPAAVEPAGNGRVDAGTTPAWRSAVFGTVLYLTFYAGMTLFNASPPKLPWQAWAFIAPITTIVYLLILVYTMRFICRLILTARQETALMFASLALFLVLNPYVRFAVGQLLAGKSLAAAFGQLSRVPIDWVFTLIVPFLLALTGIFFGQLVSRLIREKAILLPVLIIAALIDFWGVYWGFVSNMSEKLPDVVNTIGSAATAAASVPEEVRTQVPQSLSIFGNIAPPSNIGIGDFVFLALYLTCAYRLGFSAKRTMWGAFWGLLLASLIMALDGQMVHTTLFGHLIHFTIQISYLPGLVFICGGVLIANLREWKLSREEWVMTGVLVSILAALIGTSIVRTKLDEKAKLADAERNRPRIINTTYILPEMPLKGAVTAALQRIGKGAKTPVTVLPLTARFQYRIEHGRAKPVRWLMLALDRVESNKETNVHEYIVDARPVQGKPGWSITMSTISPPQNAYQFISFNKKEQLDRNAILMSAIGYPTSALALLDHTGDYVDLVGPESPAFLLVLEPNKAVIANAKGKKVKVLAYAK